MTIQNHIGVKMRDKLHLQLFFVCCRCGESICSTGVANDYNYPQWYVGKPIGFTDDGFVCYNCRKGADRQGI